MIEFYIMRHGRTVWNAAGKIQGSADIELTGDGRQGAVLTGKAWEAMDLHFDAVYASPLKRAYETAVLASGYTGLPIVRDDRLRELNFGILEGQGFEHIRDADFDPDHGCFFNHPELYRRPDGGESLEELCARAGDFLRELLERHGDGQRILIVAHGAMNKALMLNLKKTAIRDFWAGELQKNCGVNIVRVDNGKIMIAEEGKVFVTVQPAELLRASDH